MITAVRTDAARLTALDFRLEAEGIGADPVNLLLLAHTARDLGVEELMVSVMVDEDAPEVVRVRAYARVAVAVASALRASARATAQRTLQPAC